MPKQLGQGRERVNLSFYTQQSITTSIPCTNIDLEHATQRVTNLKGIKNNRTGELRKIRDRINHNDKHDGEDIGGSRNKFCGGTAGIHVQPERPK